MTDLNAMARELASQVIKDGVMDWTDWQSDLADMVAAALREAHNAALEEAAKVADAGVADDRSEFGSGWDFACDRIGQKIRDLKDDSTPGSQT